MLAETRDPIDAACALWAANGPRRRRGPCVTGTRCFCQPTSTDGRNEIKHSMLKSCFDCCLIRFAVYCLLYTNKSLVIKSETNNPFLKEIFYTNV